MGSFRAYRTSTKLEQEGVWETLPEYGNAAVLVARWENKAHVAFLRAERKRLAAELRTEDLPDDVEQDLQARAIARHILVNWRDVEEQGDYTVEKSLDVLLDPEHHDLLDRIFRLSRDRDRYLKEREEDARKN